MVSGDPEHSGVSGDPETSGGNREWAIGNSDPEHSGVNGEWEYSIVNNITEQKHQNQGGKILIILPDTSIWGF